MKDVEILPAWMIWEIERARPLVARVVIESGEAMHIPLVEATELEMLLEDPDNDPDGWDRGVCVLPSPWL